MFSLTDFFMFNLSWFCNGTTDDDKVELFECVAPFECIQSSFRVRFPSGWDNSTELHFLFHVQQKKFRVNKAENITVTCTCTGDTKKGNKKRNKKNAKVV